jgi:hypothetical protein
MSELWFHDLVPTERPAPSLFKLMWNQALASVTPGRSNFDGPGPPATPAPRKGWRQTSLESAVQSAEPPRDAPPPQSPEPIASTSREPVASPSIDATDEPATALPSPAEGSQVAQPQSAQPSEEDLPNQPSDTLPEKPAVQTTPVLPSENNELRFEDLIPDQSEGAHPPILNQGLEGPRGGSGPPVPNRTWYSSRFRSAARWANNRHRAQRRPAAQQANRHWAQWRSPVGRFARLAIFQSTPAPIYRPRAAPDHARSHVPPPW